MITKEMLLGAGVSLVWGMLGASIILGAVTYYERTHPRPQLGMVDAIAMLQGQREQALSLAIQSKDLGSQQKAQLELQAYGSQLEKAMSDVSTEHGLVLIQRQAVLAGEIVDLTDAVRNKIKTPQ